MTQGGRAARGAGSPPESVLLRRPDLHRTVLAGHVLLHDAGSHETHVLNPTSALTWEAIDGRRTIESISPLLAQETGIDEDLLAEHVALAVEQFASAGLLSLADFPRHLPPPTDPSALSSARSADRRSTDPRAGRSTDTRPAADADCPIRQTLDSPLTAVVDPLTGAPSTQPVDPAVDVGLQPRQVLGTSVAVRCGDPHLARQIETTLASYPPAPVADHELEIVTLEPDRHRLLLDGAPTGGHADGRDVVEAVVSLLNRLAVDHTPGRLLFHAGVVERDGRAVMVVGPSGRGKSTLTAALVQAGCSYLSDEVASVDPTTRWIDPFPKPLSLSAGSMALLGLRSNDDADLTTAAVKTLLRGEDQLGPIDVDPGTLASNEPTHAPDPAGAVEDGLGKTSVDPLLVGSVSDGARLGLVVLLDGPNRTEVARTGRLSNVPAIVDGFLALLDETFAPSMEVRGALDHLRDLYAQTPVLRVRRSALDSMVDEVIAALPPR